MKTKTVKTRKAKNPMFYLYPHAAKSKGAHALSLALNGTKLVGKNTTKYRETPEINDGKPYVLINWGCGSLGNGLIRQNTVVLNSVKAVNLCRNKLNFFNCQTKALHPARVPVYTEDLATAMEWVEEGIAVMGRQATGSCGQDIVFFEDDVAKFNSSEFWVQYKKKKEEYRIHFFQGNMIAVQKKAMRETDTNGEKIDPSTVDFRIRNHRNGFIFKRQDVSVPGDVVDQARLAIQNTGLDFGAVDVIWNQYEGKAYVLEINTAPGLEGTTISDYSSAILAAYG